jgi:hypothetical protein
LIPRGRQDNNLEMLPRLCLTVRDRVHLIRHCFAAGSPLDHTTGIEPNYHGGYKHLIFTHGVKL